MKWLYTLAVLGLLSCTPNLEGRYQNINLENDYVMFQNEFCHFKYFFYEVAGKYTIDNDYVFVETKSEIGTVSFRIINSYTIEGQGWVAGTYVKEGYKDKYYETLLGIYKVKSSKLNVREGPGTKYKALGTVEKGVRVQVTEIINKNWCKVQTASGEYYVFFDYLERE